jgi:hypothetical protein
VRSIDSVGDQDQTLYEFQDLLGKVRM